MGGDAGEGAANAHHSVSYAVRVKVKRQLGSRFDAMTLEQKRALIRSTVKFTVRRVGRGMQASALPPSPSEVGRGSASLFGLDSPDVAAVDDALADFDVAFGELLSAENLDARSLRSVLACLYEVRAFREGDSKSVKDENRLHGHCDDVPPAEYEEAFYASQQADPAGVGIQ